MKSYDIFVDRRLIQGDLIVVDLPLRNDIAAYDHIEIDASVKKFLGEKVLIFADNTGSIVPNSYLASGKSISAQKIEKVEPAFLIDAKADFSNLSVLRVDENRIKLDAQAEEISQKIEQALSGVAIGVNASSAEAFMTAKSTGKILGMVLLGASTIESKQSLPSLAEDEIPIVVSAILTSPLMVCYENTEADTAISANVKSLSYLTYSRLIRNEIDIGIERTIDIVPLPSLGKSIAKISIGADVSTAVRFFTEVENGTDISIFGRPTIYTLCKPNEDKVILFSTGSAIMRRFRTLAEVDELGTLASMRNMSLEDISLITIEE